MRLEYTNILDEMIKNDKVINQYIDGRNLLSYLYIHNVIDFDEKEKLYELDSMESTQHLIKVILKSRKDEDMIHFLNSLECAKYNDAFCWLTKKLENMGLTNEHQCVQIIDENRNAHQFIWFDERDPTVNFIERKVQLEELHNIMLQSGKNVGADAKKIVITGLDGIGKTQLAMRYAQLYSQQYDNNTVWINAECDATFKKSFTDLAENLKINLKNANGVEKELCIIVREVYTHFLKVKCLFVFDNADEPLKVEFYPDSEYQIYILITSRYQKWEQINIYNLSNFSPEEATDFIQTSLKIKTDIYEGQLANLAKALHFFPLALKQATAYINETSEMNKNTGSAYSVGDYINEFNEYKERLLNYKFDSEYDNKYFQTMFITWKITIDKLDRKTSENNWMQKLMKRFSLFTRKTENMANMKYEKIGKVAINILDYISCVAHEKVDMQLFFPIENKEEIGLAVQLLKQLSMVTEENGLLNVHPLIQQVTRLHVKQKGVEKETFTTVCRLVLSYFVHLEQSNDYLKKRILLPHSEKLLQEMKNWLIKNPSQRKCIEQGSIKNLLIQMSNAYDNIGQQRQNKLIVRHFLSIQLEQYGPEHYKVARSLTNLSNVYGALGLYEKQRALLEKALRIQENHYGPSHYQVARTLVNLDRAYGALGQPEKQKIMLEKALVIDEKQYGPDHYKVAVTLAKLGNVYGALGQPEKQKTMLEIALEIQNKHYGSDHYEVATTLVNLGKAYNALGQPEKQKTLLEKALEIQEKHYGTEHYQVATTLVSLGMAYGALGQHEKQKTLLKKALVIQEKHYGTDHYEVAITSEFLKNAYESLNNFEKQNTQFISETSHQNVECANLIQNQFISNNITPNVHICSPLNAAQPLPLVGTFDPNVHLLPEYTPRNVHYEIQPSDISVVMEIGDGNYGIVVKGILHNHRGLSGNIVVALKTLKHGNHLEETCLSNELNILLCIGQHCNIISMIGAITKPCHLGSFILVNEFCQLGDLECYIKQRKSLYEIGQEHLSLIDELNSVLNGSYLCFSALLMYALQIANGAYYYTQIKTVIHRDLALRNILLTSDHVVKIADFGLAVKAASYVVMNPKPSPIPWYAPECLHDTSAVFTANSDVWSYGVILWELFSLAGNVWGVQAPKTKNELLEWISLGNRYEIPKHASKEIAQLMEKCWQLLPENRPNFLQCRTEIRNILFDYSEVFNYISQKIGL